MGCITSAVNESTRASPLLAADNGVALPGLPCVPRSLQDGPGMRRLSYLMAGPTKASNWVVPGRYDAS